MSAAADISMEEFHLTSCNFGFGTGTGEQAACDVSILHLVFDCAFLVSFDSRDKSLERSPRLGSAKATWVWTAAA